MQMQGFTAKDIQEATLLADKIWEDEYVNFDKKFAQTMAEYIIRCSFLNEELALKITDNGIMNACILASEKNDIGNYAEWLKAQYKHMNEKELARAKAMHAYFSNVSEKVHNAMNEDDLYLGLFVSNQAGCGKILMQEIINLAKAKNLKNMYLWTDTTCDFDYYEKHNYILVDTISNRHLQNDYADYITYIYRKSII